MGLFSKIKKTFVTSHSSRIRALANQRMKEIKSDTQASLMDHLFTIYLDGISKWWNDSVETDLIKSESFDGDMPIFEVGCYLIFRTDLWFFMNQFPDEVRKPIIQHLTNSFIQLIQSETDLKNADEVFNDRQQLYSSTLKEGEELPIEEFLFNLEQLILKTKHRQLPKILDGKSLPVDLDFGSGISVKLNIGMYEKHMVPAFFKSLEGIIQIANERGIRK